MKIFLSILIVLLVISGLYYLVSPALHQTKLAACTQEAKLCANGSAVGRIGPNCEFAACPGEDLSTWQTFNDVKLGISFKYPEELATNYVRLVTVDWPPKISLKSGPFSCSEAGSANVPTGQTGQQTINGHVYCVTKESQGAAGSIYTLYTYAFPQNNKVVILTFALQLPQCANYSEPQKTACMTEETNFNIGSIVDDIVGALIFQKQ